MAGKKFKTTLVPRGPNGAWTFMPIPFDVEKVFGKRSRIAVCGTVNGFAFRNSIMPTGDGGHEMMFAKALQQGAGAVAGDVVEVYMEADLEPRKVEVPNDLAEALRGDARAEELFAKASFSCQKEFVVWIEEAKRAETRQRRIANTLLMLHAGRQVKS
jgi:hypothetical protein